MQSFAPRYEMNQYIWYLSVKIKRRYWRYSEENEYAYLYLRQQLLYTSWMFAACNEMNKENWVKWHDRECKVPK